MKGLEDAVKTIIADTRRNKLVWEPLLSNSIATKTKLGGYLNIVGEADVELIRSERYRGLVEVFYKMRIDKQYVDSDEYEPLKQFGHYMFVD